MLPVRMPWMAAAFGLVLTGCQSLEKPAGHVAGFNAACPFRVDAGPAEERHEQWAAATDEATATLPALNLQYDRIEQLTFNPPVLYGAGRGECQWLLDASGSPLPVSDPDHLLTGVLPLTAEGSGESLLQLELYGPIEARANHAEPSTRLLRFADGQPTLSPRLDPSPQFEHWPPRLYQRDAFGDGEEADFDLRRARYEPKLIARPIDGQFGVLDRQTMRFIVPPVYAEIRGYAVSTSPATHARLWAAIATVPRDGSAPVSIELFDSSGKRLFANLTIGGVEPARLSALLALRLRDATLPPVSISKPPTQPAPASNKSAEDFAVAAADAAVFAAENDEYRAAMTGNACVYTDATGRLLDVPPAIPSSYGRCPQADSDGLLLLHHHDARNTLLQVATTSAEVPPRRLGIRAVDGRIVALRRRIGLDQERHDMAIVARGKAPRLRYSIHALDGRRLHADDFDGFRDLGCQFWEVHDAIDNRWLSVTLDGSLDKARYYPFSC